MNDTQNFPQTDTYRAHVPPPPDNPNDIPQIPPEAPPIEEPEQDIDLPPREPPGEIRPPDQAPGKRVD